MTSIALDNLQPTETFAWADVPNYATVLPGLVLGNDVEVRVLQVPMQRITVTEGKAMRGTA